MINSSKPSFQKFSQLSALVTSIVLSIVIPTAKEASAIPLEPILDRVGRNIVEKTLIPLLSL